MRWRIARGSRHRRRGVGHDAARKAALGKARLKALLTAGAALTLAACATTSHEISRPTPTQIETPESPGRPPATPDARVLMIDAATSMLGQPYRYGGAAPGGFDCSGLAVYAAAGANIRLPRTAAEQLEFGLKVARNDLQAGDL